MRIFMAGGSGVLGRRLLPQLRARGHDVTATTTTPAKLDLLRDLGAHRAVLMNGLDVAAVHEAVAAARPDAIIDEMTGLSGAHTEKLNPRHADRFFAPTNRLRTEGIDHLLSAAAKLGVPHVVAQSHGSFTGARTGGWVKTEEDPLEPTAETSALIHLEHVVVKAGGAVLRYGAFYGEGANAEQLDLVRKRLLPLIGAGTGYCSWIHVDDAAAATVLAVEQQAIGIFNIVDDDPAPAHLWLPHLARCLGAKPPRRLPIPLAKLLAGDTVVGIMTEGRAFANTKAKRELGWQPRYPSWRQGFREAFAEQPKMNDEA